MTAKLTYDEVKQAIPNFSEREIKDLYNRCKILLKAEPAVDNTDWLLDGILTELRSNGLYVPAFSKIKALSIYSTYAEKSEHLREVLEKQGISTKLEKRQLAIICSKVLIEYLRSFTDVSLHTMLMYVDRIPEALERAFPGYVQSRMLMFLLNKKTVH